MKDGGPKLSLPDPYLQETDEVDLSSDELSLSASDRAWLKTGMSGTSRLPRVVLRLSNEMIDDLDDIVDMLVGIGYKQLSRAAVMRAALTMWVEIAKDASPAKVADAVCKAHVPRGRKKSQ